MDDIAFESLIALIGAVVRRAELDAPKDPDAHSFLQELRQDFAPTLIPRKREQRHATTRWALQESREAQRIRRSRMS